jgi:hypothetical protein
MLAFILKPSPIFICVQIVVVAVAVVVMTDFIVVVVVVVVIIIIIHSHRIEYWSKNDSKSNHYHILMKDTWNTILLLPQCHVMSQVEKVFVMISYRLQPILSQETHSLILF